MTNYNTETTQEEYSIDKIAQNEYKNIIHQTIQKINLIENNLFFSSIRKKFYKIKGWYKRTILTVYGEISYRRRLYISKTTGKGVFIVDNLLQIEKYSRLSAQAIMIIAEKAISLKSYKQAGEHSLLGIIVSKQTVANCIDKVEFLRKKKTKKDVDCLYIDVDGYFANYKLFKKKKEIKFANIYTGIDYNPKHRNKLKCKNVITSNKRNQNFAKLLNYNVNRLYNINDNTRIYIQGDGAPWIKALVNEVPNSVFVIDKFHMLRAARNLPIPEDALRGLLDYNLELISSQKDLCITEAQKNNLTYVINNFLFTKHWNNDDFIGVHAENVVSHVFNYRIRGITRNWGSRLYKINHALALASTDDLAIKLDTETSEYLSLEDYFKVNSLNIKPRYLNDVSIPILNSSASNTTVKIIKKLIYSY